MDYILLPQPEQPVVDVARPSMLGWLTSSGALNQADRSIRGVVGSYVDHEVVSGGLERLPRSLRIRFNPPERALREEGMSTMSMQHSRLQKRRPGSRP